MDLLVRARELGAVVNSNSLCLPARSVATFLREAANAGWQTTYVECLYFYEAEGAPRAGTEPSMELSPTVAQFSAVEEFIEGIRSAAEEAIRRSSAKGARPFFEVGVYPELDPKDSGIWVRG